MTSHKDLIYTVLTKEAEKIKNNDNDYRNYEFSIRIRPNQGSGLTFESLSQFKSTIETNV